MKGNIPNHPNYHITKDGRLFSNKSGEWVERKGQVYIANRLNLHQTTISKILQDKL